MTDEQFKFLVSYFQADPVELKFLLDKQGIIVAPPPVPLTVGMSFDSWNERYSDALCIDRGWRLEATNGYTIYIARRIFGPVNYASNEAAAAAVFAQAAKGDMMAITALFLVGQDSRVTYPVPNVPCLQPDYAKPVAEPTSTYQILWNDNGEDSTEIKHSPAFDSQTKALDWAWDQDRGNNARSVAACFNTHYQHVYLRSPDGALTDLEDVPEYAKRINNN